MTVIPGVTQWNLSDTRVKIILDRDDYVFIDAEEVTDGHLHNFNKYDFQ